MKPPNTTNRTHIITKALVTVANILPNAPTAWKLDLKIFKKVLQTLITSSYMHPKLSAKIRQAVNGLDLHSSETVQQIAILKLPLRHNSSGSLICSPHSSVRSGLLPQAAACDPATCKEFCREAMRTLQVLNLEQDAPSETPRRSELKSSLDKILYAFSLGLPVKAKRTWNYQPKTYIKGRNFG